MQGVEKRAADALRMQQDQGPMPPMVVNGGARFQAPATMATPTAPALAPAPMVPVMASAAPRPAPVMSAPAGFGGVDSRPLSARGPARAPVGVGTNNPNAVRVGPMRAPGERALSIAARRGNVQAAGMLYGASQGAQSDQARMAFQAEQEQLKMQQRGQEMQMQRGFQLQDQANQQSFTQQRDAAAAAERQKAMEQGRAYTLEDQRAEQARQDKINQMPVETVPVPGTDYVVPRIGGKVSANLVPISKAPQMMSPEDIAAARAMGGDVQIDQGNARVNLPGLKQAGQTANLPDGIQYERDDVTKRIIGAVYPKYDEQAGKWTLARIDLNGDGVVSPAEQQQAMQAGDARTTKSGNTIKRL